MTRRLRPAHPALWLLWLAGVVWASAASADEVDACVSAADKAQRLRREGKLRAASAELAICSRDACPKLVRKDCQKWASEVTAGLASVVIRAEDPAHQPLPDVNATLDGAPVFERLDGTALPLDPGDHTLRVERSGRVAVEQQVTLMPGEHDRLLVFTLQPLAAPSVAEAAPPPRRLVAEAPRARVPAGAWITGGVAVATIGAGVALWALGLSERSALYAGCGQTHTCTTSEVDSSKNKLIAGDIAAGVGIAALGATALIVLSSRRTSSPAAAIEIAPVAGGGVAGLTGSF